MIKCDTTINTMTNKLIHKDFIIKLDRENYLLIYYVLASNIFGIKPFGVLAEIGRGIPFLVCQLIWLWIGIHIFKYQRTNISNHGKNYIFLYLFILALLPSVVTANVYFGQSYLQSLVSYRDFFLLWAIPALFIIAPTPKEIANSLYTYLILFLIITFIRTYITESIFDLLEREQEMSIKRGYADSEDFLKYPIVNLYYSTIIPLYYYCVRLWTTYNRKYLVRATIIVIALILLQNRSTLFPALLFYGITLFKCNFKSKVLKGTIVGITGLAFLYFGATKVSNLLLETEKQVNSTGDPRVLAMAYFLDLDNINLAQSIFGTGNISFKTSSYVEILQDNEIHYSDVGFIGFWHQYGIISVALFLFYLLKGLLSKYQPWSVRYLAFSILLCGGTISYFGAPEHMLRFILYYYLYCYYRLYKDKIID